jgi:hypothetical protein
MTPLCVSCWLAFGTPPIRFAYGQVANELIECGEREILCSVPLFLGMRDEHWHGIYARGVPARMLYMFMSSCKNLCIA